MIPENINANDFETTTYVEREKKRQIDFALASGEITEEEAELRRNRHRHFKHKSALQAAAAEGSENDPVRVAAIESEIDQEFAALHRHDEQVVTETAKVVFSQLGFLAHPGMDWEDLDIDQQDLYRRTGDEVISHHYETKDTDLEESSDDLEL